MPKGLWLVPPLAVILNAVKDPEGTSSTRTPVPLTLVTTNLIVSLETHIQSGVSRCFLASSAAEGPAVSPYRSYSFPICRHKTGFW
jgi:hypothetical protein